MAEDPSGFQQNGTDFDKENASLTMWIKMDNPDEMLSAWTRSPDLPYIVLCHIVFGLFGCFGNVLVITIMISDKKTRNATTHLFLRSLAFADLFLLMLCTPLEIYQYFVFQWDEYGVICKLASFAEFMSAIASVLNMVAVTIERFIVIVFPLKSRSVCTINNCRRAVFFVWFLAGILATPVLMTKGTFTMVYFNNTTSVSIHYCNDTDDEFAQWFSLYQLALLFVLPGSIMSLCYSYVILELWKSTKNMKILTNSGSTDTRRTRTKRTPMFKRRALPESSVKLEVDGSKGISDDDTECMPGLDDIRVAEQDEDIEDNRGGESADDVPTSDARRGGQRANEAGTSTESKSKRYDEVKTARKQVIKMLVMVVTLFVVCWGPKVVMIVLIKFRAVSFSQDVYTVRTVINFLPFMHACVNPCIYCVMSKNFHKCVFRQFDRLRCRKGNSSVTRETRSRESGGTRVTSARQYRRRESATSMRTFQVHRGSTTTSSTNMNVTEIIRPTPEQKQEDELVDKVEVDQDQIASASATFEPDETAL